MMSLQWICLATPLKGLSTEGVFKYILREYDQVPTRNKLCWERSDVPRSRTRCWHICGRYHHKVTDVNIPCQLTVRIFISWLRIVHVTISWRTAWRVARVDWVRERYGFISVGFCQRRTLLTLSVDHVRINTFCLYLLLPPWRGDVCCSIHHLFISNRSLLFIFWQYKPEQNLRWHDRRPAVVVLHLPPVERLGSGLYFK